MVRDGLELICTLSIGKSLFKGLVLSSRTYVLFLIKWFCFILAEHMFYFLIKNDTFKNAFF